MPNNAPAGAGRGTSSPGPGRRVTHHGCGLAARTTTSPDPKEDIHGDPDESHTSIAGSPTIPPGYRARWHRHRP